MGIHPNQTYLLYTDGGSRNNPGPAGAGWVIKDLAGQTIAEESRYLGTATNNEAEYQALIFGLKTARKLGIKRLQCFLDSNLVVNQLNGIFRIKKSHLRELILNIKGLEQKFDNLTYQYVPREENYEADRLANKAINNGNMLVPPSKTRLNSRD